MSMINALTAICVAKLRLRISSGMTMGAIHTFTSKPNLRKRKRFAKKQWKDVRLKPSAATVAKKRWKDVRSKPSAAMEPKVSIEIARFVNTFVGVAGRSWRLVSRAVSLGRTVRVARKRKYSWTISAIEVSGQAVRELESLYSRRANEERARRHYRFRRSGWTVSPWHLF